MILCSTRACHSCQCPSRLEDCIKIRHQFHIALRALLSCGTCAQGSEVLASPGDNVRTQDEFNATYHSISITTIAHSAVTFRTLKANHKPAGLPSMEISKKTLADPAGTESWGGGVFVLLLLRLNFRANTTNQKKKIFVSLLLGPHPRPASYGRRLVKHITHDIARNGRF
jgi:hypothetical protein